jgi:choline dehydrogenase
MTGPVDVVVIGAGSAGCVVSSRLSNDRSRQVLLIEAGPDLRPGALPDELRYLSRPISWPLDWRDSVESIGGRRLNYGRGRVVGGSSATNGGVALRPEPPDFAAWPDPWTWERMLEHLCRIESDLDFGDAPHHGESGPIPIRRWPRSEWSRLQAAFHDGAVAIGMPVCADQNAPHTTGVGPVPMNRIGRERLSNAHAFLEPVRHRENLSVRSDAHVRRVIVRDGHAEGVELTDGTVIHAGEVVLCAGVVQDPMLLWRSGIGPAASLRALGIDVLVDNPMVGANLTDHLVVTYAVEVPLDLVDEGAPTIQTILRTTSPSGDENGLQLTPFLRRHPDGRRSIAISISAQLPRGLGSITPTGAAPDAAARIAWPFADIRENVETLRAGWRLAARIVEAAGVALDAESVRASRDLDDDELDAHIVANHEAFYHGVGTCRMAAPEDPSGVVDPELTVRGVEQLRIIDASVVPTVPRSNTHLLVTALAHAAVSERAATPS